jgi:putative phosphoribosyl transferase
MGAPTLRPPSAVQVPGGDTGSRAASRGRAVSIPVAAESLPGTLTLPGAPCGLVLFAHGSGSSRLSPRNQGVAATLTLAGLGTLLFDLLTPREEMLDAATGELRFDVELLADRLLAATQWVRQQPTVGDLPLGYFGSSTGAAAALVAAAQRPEWVAAVVSRGGRPDLAGEALRRVRAPTLLIVGGHDLEVMRLNERAMAAMTAPVDLRLVPGASHLFSEPGTLEHVAALAGEWFLRHLR